MLYSICQIFHKFISETRRVFQKAVQSCMNTGVSHEIKTAIKVLGTATQRELEKVPFTSFVFPKHFFSEFFPDLLFSKHFKEKTFLYLTNDKCISHVGLNTVQMGMMHKGTCVICQLAAKAHQY